jgi:hypothetical protein
VLSKILLVVLALLLASKLGLRTKLRQWMPQVDRAVNYTIIGLVIIYLGQLIWWLIKGRTGD